MDRRSSHLPLLCLLVALLSSTSLLHSCGAQPAQNISDDRDALLRFKTFTDAGGMLNVTWQADTNPCTWVGIRCSNGIVGRVTKVLVKAKQLTGVVPENSLGRLSELRNLDLSNNSFSGPFPSDFSNLNLVQLWAENSSFSGPFPNITSNSTRLNKLLLSGNNLSGPIPDLNSLTNLMELDLSLNSFQGVFPAVPFLLVALSPSSNSLKDSVPLDQAVSLSAATGTMLSTLNLSGNNFSGSLPNLSGLLNLSSLDLSNNSFQGQIPSLPSNLTALDMSFNTLLTGNIPPALAAKFPNAFQGDTGLCGNGTTNTCAAAVPLTPPPGVSNPSTNAPAPAPGTSSSSTLTTRNAIFIAVGAVVLVVIVAFIFVRYCSKREKKPGTPTNKKVPPEKLGDSSGAGVGLSSIGGDSDRSKLSFIDDSQQGYDLEDLLRASAEMLGKGSFGTAYKAVMESGMIVAVKRLRDVKDIRRNEFSQHMELLGRLKHPNIVPLRAYYYAREEKLLIYDFMPNGSLFSLLHGSRGPGRTPLEWPARLSIAQGVAKGLTYLHQECGHKIPHANIKSSNVLMGKNFEVCISDFGLVPLMPTQIAAQRMAGYRAPEYSQARKITYKADVYSFGVLLLELLTGRQPAQSISDNGLDLPKWVQSVVREEWTGEVFDLELKSYLHGEEEMVTLLQVAMSCVEPKPDERPEMAAVVELLEGIRRGDSVIDSESYQSHSSEGDYSGRDLPPSA
ncbi:unnamed protein product [Calypogeia fissa]